MASRRIERLKKVILRKASDVILYELHDPRLGFVTLSKVDLTDDLRYATLHYSVIGGDAARSKTAHALEGARGYVQKAVAGALRTRVTPHLRFKFDESIEGALRVSRLIDRAVAADEAQRRDRGDAPEAAEEAAAKEEAGEAEEAEDAE